MAQRLIVATANAGKAREFKKMLPAFDVCCFADLGVHCDVEETGTTFYENALIKAKAVCQALGAPALADDSGLCVDALDGAPGVYSARYAGGHGDDAANNALLLKNLSGKAEGERTAYFESCVALCLPDGRSFTASGRTYGKILSVPEGENGFGYDPLFFSDELGKSFGIASAEEKNAVSHRAKALAALSEKIKGLSV